MKQRPVFRRLPAPGLALAPVLLGVCLLASCKENKHPPAASPTVVYPPSPPAPPAPTVVCPPPEPADFEPLGEGIKVFAFSLLAAVVVIAVVLLVRARYEP